MIRNVIFDIGNVLVDFCWQEHIRRCGYAGERARRLGEAMMLSPAWHELDRGVQDEEEILSAFIRNDPELETEIRRVFADLSTLIRVFPGTEAWIRRLRDAGYRTFYLSNFPAKVEREGADQITFLAGMDGGILSHRVKMVKPEPGIYRLLLECYGLTAAESVFLDDSPANIKTACELGMQGILVKDQEQAMKDLDGLLEEQTE